MNREELLKQAKPILFNTEMVKAILEGRKTVTRRLVKPKSKNACGFFVTFRKSDGSFMGVYDYDENERMFESSQKPLCVAGDYLYVRETWTEEYKEFYYRADYDSDYLEPCETLSGGYPADCRYYPGCVGCTRGRQRIIWKPSIHMPKEAARLFLKVTDVRVERLQDITEEQALAEGVPEEHPMNEVYCPRCKGEGLVGALSSDLGFMEVDCHYCDTATKRFSNLWNSTIKKADLDKYGWEANPWVWVIEFARIEV